MPRSIKKISLITSLQIIGMVFGLFSVVAPNIAAQASQQQLTVGEIIPCGSVSPNYYDTFSQPMSGAIYGRLPKGSSPSVVYLYSETTAGSSCQLLGAAKITSNKWLFLGNGKSITTIMTQTPELSAQSSKIVINLLDIPNPDICLPAVTCNLNYSGDLGYLEPSLVTGTTNQITVYEANSIIDVKFSNIKYYSGGTFLYSSTQLKPINHDYLAGGKHDIFIQVNFVNGEKININQVVNMGTDWTGALKLRSAFYRSDNKLVFSGIVIVVLGILIFALWLVIKAYKRRAFKIDHGIDEYDGLDMINHSNKPDDNNPTLG